MDFPNIRLSQSDFVGDEITVTTKVTRKSPATRMLILEVSVTNQHGHEVVKGYSTVRMIEQKEQTVSKPMVAVSFDPDVESDGHANSESVGNQKVILVTGGSRDWCCYGSETGFGWSHCCTQLFTCRTSRSNFGESNS